MNNLVKHIKGFMSNDDAVLIHEYVKTVDNKFENFGNNEKEFTFYSEFNDDSIKKLLDRYGSLVREFVQNNYDGNFNDFDSSKTHIARFLTGYGMHEHFDINRPNDIATLIYLNSDYEGGEIYFPELNIYIKPQSGDLVCFPDTPDFVHGVKPITKGTRYTSPQWITRVV